VLGIATRLANFGGDPRSFVLVYALLSVVAGCASAARSRLAVIVVMTLVAGSALIATDGQGHLSSARKPSPASNARRKRAPAGRNEVSVRFPLLAHAPFGLGLGRLGRCPASAGSRSSPIEENASSRVRVHALDRGSRAARLLLWIGFSVNVIVLGVAAAQTGQGP